MKEENKEENGDDEWRGLEKRRREGGEMRKGGMEMVPGRESRLMRT